MAQPSPLTPRPQLRAAVSDAAPAERLQAIGQRLRSVRPLTDAQIEQILLHQRQHGLRFGDAAVALKLATPDEVTRALAQQFDFPYATGQHSRLGSELVTATQPFSDQAEVFRELRSRLLLEHLDPPQPRLALAVLSTDLGDGKTYTAANLAVSLSQLGRRTLLVDADLRRPRQHQLFGLPSRGGLSGVLAGHQAAAEVIRGIDELPSLELLPAGSPPPNPQELLQRPTFTLLMQELLTRFDHVIVDTPAACQGADARLLAAKCGAALIVGRRGRSPLKELQTLGAAMARTGTRLTGVLINQH
ncbi:MAG: tyrosine protein kinase [Roseateles depolymerans]|uniref:Tyrosine protein kinase n=1 Tax=Roseateles depolymerans TaxID=76731 RepID=A0A2W5DU17_9BURK|nr:MAG: tyrosine protein kinase [Roseateles depolymerans]